jgi:hypothetical protein
VGGARIIHCQCDFMREREREKAKSNTESKIAAAELGGCENTCSREGEWMNRDMGSKLLNFHQQPAHSRSYAVIADIEGYGFSCRKILCVRSESL